MYVVLTLLSLLPLCIAGQVVWIYLGEGAELRAQGERQARSQVVLPAKRGEILDRAGRALAVNTPSYDLALDPTVAGFSGVESSFFGKLSRLTGEPARSIRRKVRQRASLKFVRLATGLTEDQKRKITSWEVPGVILTQKFARRYNYDKTAAHLLGHVDVDGTGTAGLELQFDAFLRGQPGRRSLLRDRRGHRRIDVEGTVVEPQDGQTIVLTIDLIRQTILEEELVRGIEESGASSASAIAVDPQTGAILALANVPTYNPNRPKAYAQASQRNRAITDRMEPGSTFKLVGASAALEHGVVTMDERVDTGNGYATFRGRPMRDTHAHGVIPFSEVIVLSSNIGMAKTALKLKKGDLYQYARRFGFGQRTWIDLPGEVGGLLKKTNQWSGTTLTSMSIGYEVDVTPLQMVLAYAALANGGLLVQPYVVAERRDLTGKTIWRADRDQARQDSVRRVFNPETAETLRPAFEGVVNEGTATKAQVEGLPIAGKTGTARKASRSGGYGAGYRATFVGFFPADDPQVAMIVVMDSPKTSIYGGMVSAPVFKRVAERWIGTFPRIAERLAPVDALPEAQDQPVPDVTHRPAAVAAHQLRAAGYRVASFDDSSPALVARQQPEAGTPAKPGALVRLTLEADTSEAQMPDLTGLGAREALFWLQAHGVKVRVEGSGHVVSQSPEAGAALPREAVLRFN